MVRGGKRPGPIETPVGPVGLTDHARDRFRRRFPGVPVAASLGRVGWLTTRQAARLGVLRAAGGRVAADPVAGAVWVLAADPVVAGGWTAVTVYPPRPAARRRFRGGDQPEGADG